MIAADRKFLRRLRRVTRAAVRANPALRRERRRLKRRWTQNLTFQSLRGLVPLVVLAGAAAGPQVNDALPFLTVWTLAITLFRVGQIVTALRNGPALSIYYALPVSNEAVYHHQVRVVLRSAVWLGLDWLGFGVAAALQQETAVAWMAAPLFAVAQASVALAVAAALAAWRPHFPFAVIGVYLAAGMWVLLQLGRTGTATAPVVGAVLRTLTRFTPGGWLGLAQADVLRGGLIGWLVVVTTGVVVGVWLRQFARRALATFRLEPLMGYQESTTTDQAARDGADHAALRSAGFEIGNPVEGEIEAEEEVPYPPPAPATLAPSDLSAWRARVDDVLSTAPGLTLFRRGWLEARVTRLLSMRQRVLVDFLRARGPGWGRQWLTALLLILLTAVIRNQGYHEEWIVWLPGIALVFFALPTFGGAWNGFLPVVSSNGQTGVYAFLPLGFFELAGTVLTVNALRCVAAVPLVALAVRFGFTVVPIPWDVTLGLTARVLAIALAALPLWILIGFSKTTNDSSARWWFGLFLIGLILTAFISGVTLGMALFLAESAGAMIACAALLLVMSYGLLAVYGWAWGRGIFDLVGKLPRR